MQNRSVKLKIKRRIRSKIIGSYERPRLSVYRSSKNLYAQIINDEKGETLVSFSSLNLKSDKKGLNKVQVAELVGGKLAQLALKKKIKSIVFDRNVYRYHGRVKNLADGARKGGLKF